MSATSTSSTCILAISGSMRVGSVNTALLRAAARVVDDGTSLELWGGLGAIPPFTEDTEHDTPAAVADMRAAIAGADALRIPTPEYDGSRPGQLENALDRASRPCGDSVLTGMPVAVASAGPGEHGGARAAEHLATVLGIAGSTVLDRVLCLPLADQAFHPGTDRFRDRALGRPHRAGRRPAAGRSTGPARRRPTRLPPTTGAPRVR